MNTLNQMQPKFAQITINKRHNNLEYFDLRKAVNLKVHCKRQRRVKSTQDANVNVLYTSHNFGCF